MDRTAIRFPPAHHTPITIHPGRRRKRAPASVDSGLESADDAGEDASLATDRRKRAPAVKRACNECRQQKLRCNVVEDPFMQCVRCRRLGLPCKIESSFKRVGKRSRNAQMERELAELRKQLASTTEAVPALAPVSLAGIERSPPPSAKLGPDLGPGLGHPGSDAVVASLLDLRHGHGAAAAAKVIGAVSLLPDRTEELFSRFFRCYHPLLPLLDPSRRPDDYYASCRLLFWTVISIAARRFPHDADLFAALARAVPPLIWSTMAEIPQSHHVVQALCLLCSWPFPVASTSADPTFMLTGLMMNVAMQIGLHRPSYAQHFARFHVRLRDEDIKDRVKTWAACNIVAQSVGTGYGQRQPTRYDWTLKSSPATGPSDQLPHELTDRLRIEEFCERVTIQLYSNPLDPVGLAPDGERSSLCSLLASEFEILSDQLQSSLSAINGLHLRAANLHLRLSAFFHSSTTKSDRPDLFDLYHATTSFLQQMLTLERSDAGLLLHATNYLWQMILAAGFALYKLLNSFFRAHVDLDEGRTWFHQTISAIRRVSVVANDLPARLAEVLAQLWRGARAGTNRHPSIVLAEECHLDDSLTLKVRCRMSMSLVYDSVWRWREEFQAKGRGNLDAAVRNPTNPDIAAEPSSSSTASPSPSSAFTAGSQASSPDSTDAVVPTATVDHHHLASSPDPPPPDLAIAIPSGSNDGLFDLGSAQYEVFDPLNWMLDGLIDFPSLLGEDDVHLPGFEGAGQGRRGAGVWAAPTTDLLPLDGRGPASRPSAKGRVYKRADISMGMGVEAEPARRLPATSSSEKSLRTWLYPFPPQPYAYRREPAQHEDMPSLIPLHETAKEKPPAVEARTAPIPTNAAVREEELAPQNDDVFWHEFDGRFSALYWRRSYFPRHPDLLARLLGTRYQECVRNLMDFFHKHGDVDQAQSGSVRYARAVCEQTHPEDYQAVFGRRVRERQGVLAQEPTASKEGMHEGVDQAKPVHNESAKRRRKKKKKQSQTTYVDHDDGYHSHHHPTAFSVVLPHLRQSLVRSSAAAAAWLRSSERSLAPDFRRPHGTESVIWRAE
ncbi:MAG: hypothetical protein M1826_007665 [Phylliscum demangeonii]|nr:MAG: hypothetical protein M1826_007665 [Phylliscum demangeonii]